MGAAERSATDGVFKGIVKATDFQTPDGTSMMKNGKFDSKYLDLGGIVIDGETGNINFTSVGSITWGGNAPVKYQFSTSLSGPWHDTMQTNDKYRRDCISGTWGEAYQFRGTDGKNGTVNYDKVNQILKETYGITTTYITEGAIGSPVIQGAQIYGCEIYAGGLNGGQIIGLTSGGINIFNGGGERVLTIFGNDDAAKLTTGYNSLEVNAPFVYIDATDYITFSGLTADFTKVKEVKGIHATFA